MEPAIVRSEPLVLRPKILLHDHFDGGLRPATVIDLARQNDYRDLPTHDPDELAAWFHRGAGRRSLALYLETFRHTVGVLSTPDSIERVAFECAEDLAADGVVYAESRFAPELVANGDNNMSLDDAIAAMARGFELAGPLGIELRIIVCSMRNFTISAAAAAAAVRGRDLGVVGFDIAGPEAGFPPADHLEAFTIARNGGLGVTIHAGEADGLGSIIEAMQDCAADRLGHGVRVTDDILSVPGDGQAPGHHRLGTLAAEVRDRRLCLEVCPTSNVHTGVGGITELAAHPIDLLAREGFAVTVNTDNRLMSGITLSGEYASLAETFGWGPDQFDAVEETALRSAFCDDGTRRRLRERLDQARAEADLTADLTADITADITVEWGATPS